MRLVLNKTVSLSGITPNITVHCPAIRSITRFSDNFSIFGSSVLGSADFHTSFQISSTCAVLKSADFVPSNWNAATKVTARTLTKMKYLVFMVRDDGQRRGERWRRTPSDGICEQAPPAAIRSTKKLGARRWIFTKQFPQSLDDALDLRGRLRWVHIDKAWLYTLPDNRTSIRPSVHEDTIVVRKEHRDLTLLI